MTERILVISDIHGNMPALEQVISHAGVVDQVWCLGDIIGYGPHPNECVDLIRQLNPAISIMGNHDAAAVGLLGLSAFNYDARISSQWTSNVLTLENQNYLLSLPQQIVVNHATLVHGTPSNPLWEYMLDSYTAHKNFSLIKTPLCFVGHTHIPGIFQLNHDLLSVNWLRVDSKSPVICSDDAQMIINPGSVGQPRDHDNRASYGILSISKENKTWQNFRVPYDYSAVQTEIFMKRLPHNHGDRLTDGW